MSILRWTMARKVHILLLVNHFWYYYEFCIILNQIQEGENPGVSRCNCFYLYTESEVGVVLSPVTHSHSLKDSTVFL